MAKEKEAKEAVQEVTVEEQKAEELKKDKSKKEKVEQTICWLKSKANYIIEVKDGSQSKFIQPFGKIKVTKEQLSFVNNADAYKVTFIKA